MTLRVVSRRNASTAITRRCTSGSSVRPSLWNSELMCFSTARSVRNSDLAIAALFLPCAMCDSTSRSRSVSCARGECAIRSFAATSASTTLGSRTEPPRGDLLERADELLHVGDPLLQQVAQPAGAVFQQVVGVVLLDELRQDDDADARDARRGSASRPRCPRWCRVGGIRMSVRTASGCELLDRGQQFVEVGRGADELDLGRPRPGAPLFPHGPGSYPPRTRCASWADGTRGRLTARMTIRVVLGEDNVLVREGVRALLNSYDDIEVVGVAEDAPSLLAAAAEHVPDVVVTDIKMPPSFQLEGIDCAHAIRRDHPDTGVVVLSAHDDEEYALALLGRRSQRARVPAEGSDRAGRRARRGRSARSHAGGSAIDPAIAERLSGRSNADEEDRRVLDMMSAGQGVRGDGRGARHHAGGGGPSRDRSVPSSRRVATASAASTT